MNKKKKQDRLATLQEKAAFGSISPQEEAEIERLTEYLDEPATEGQVEYIEDLLDKLGADLDEYTETPIDLLTFTEASDLIDLLKEDVTDAGAWDY